MSVSWLAPINIPPNNKYCLLLQSRLHNLTASFTGNNSNKKTQPCSYKKSIFFLPLFFLKISSPSRCARQHPMIVMRLESVHATASLGQAGRKGKTDYHFHSVCIVGAPEPTSELLLPLLDWSCQSCSAHVCVIPTTNTSTTAACSDEQAQTYVYAYS